LVINGHFTQTSKSSSTFTLPIFVPNPDEIGQLSLEPMPGFVVSLFPGIISAKGVLSASNSSNHKTPLVFLPDSKAETHNKGIQYLLMFYIFMIMIKQLLIVSL
jgi:hypothetical protein